MEQALLKILILPENELNKVPKRDQNNAEGWEKYWSKKLNIPQFKVSDFITEQDFTIAKIWKKDPGLNNTSLDFLLEEEMDKFTNELRISTFRSRTFCFPYEHPIDLLYISKPEGEQFYVLYTAEKGIRSNGKIIFNIDGKTNVELKIDNKDLLVNGKTEVVFNNYDDKTPNEIVSFLPISKEDFLKCCNAKHLSVSVRRTNSSVDYENECDEIIPYFQMLYNKVCDSTMFTEGWQQEIRKQFKTQVCNEISSCVQIDEEVEKEGKREDLRYTLSIAIPILIGIIVAIVLIVTLS